MTDNDNESIQQEMEPQNELIMDAQEAKTVDGLFGQFTRYRGDNPGPMSAKAFQVWLDNGKDREGFVWHKYPKRKRKWSGKV